MKNKVFIATSIDGYIAGKDGGIEWLHSILNPEGDDMGYNEFMSGIDAIVMGRKTFEIVQGFDMDWPYQVPVFVLSNSLKEAPEDLIGKVNLVKGDLKDILKIIHGKGFQNLYIDGGKTIQSFLREDLIDEMTITTIPILLGEGIPLFSNLPKTLMFKCVSSKVFLDAVPQSFFVRSKY